MKSAVYQAYGHPEVVAIAEQSVPTSGPRDLLIRVQASTVAATDSTFRQGKVWTARLFTGLRQPKRQVLGSEFAGEVVAVGDQVTRFQVGDQVFGPTEEGFGAHAEYMVLSEDSVLARRPAQLSVREAAAMSSGAMTALPFLAEVAKLQRGQRILIIGASGSVGSFAVQMAHQLGAHVTGVCSQANVSWVRELGADRVIDYTQEDFLKTGDTYDIVFDSVGKSGFAAAKQIVRPGGQYLTTVLSLKILWQGFWSARRGKVRARFAATGLRTPEQKQADLNQILEQIQQGHLKAVVDRVYGFSAIREAHAYVDRGHKKGNVVVQWEANAAGS